MIFYLGIIFYHEKVYDLHNDLPLLPEKIKIQKFKKLVANLYDKTKYAIHIRNLKPEFNQELVLKKLHRIVKFKQKSCLKSYIDMSIDL